MKRTVSILALTACLVVSLAATASAGGWSVTTFDETPAGLEAGETYELGYTIRAHGVTPMDVASTEIRFIGDGETLAFEGVSDGVTGHYIARVTIPESGEWNWEVAHDHMTQDLGRMTVTAPDPTSSSTGSLLTALRIVLPAVTILALGLALLQFRKLGPVTQPAADAG